MGGDVGIDAVVDFFLWSNFWGWLAGQFSSYSLGDLGCYAIGHGRGGLVAPVAYCGMGTSTFVVHFEFHGHLALGYLESTRAAPCPHCFVSTGWTFAVAKVAMDFALLGFAIHVPSVDMADASTCLGSI